MIEDENYRRIERDVFDTRDLDALEINPQRKPHESYDDPANHKVQFADLRLSAFICGSNPR